MGAPSGAPQKEIQLGPNAHNALNDHSEPDDDNDPNDPNALTIDENKPLRRTRMLATV